MHKHAAKLLGILLAVAACGSDSPPMGQGGCNMQSGLGCLCNSNAGSGTSGGCPTNTTCVDVSGNGKGMCSHSCTDQTAAADCPYGGPGTGACVFTIGASSKTCGLRCGTNRTCPNGFTASDILLDGDRCACVPL